MENIGLEGVDVMADVLNITSSVPNIGTDVSLDLELGLQRPRRSYNPRNGPQRSRPDGHEEPQASAVSPSIAPIGTLGQDTMVRHSRTPNNEDSAVDSVAQNSMSRTAVSAEAPNRFTRSKDTSVLANAPISTVSI